MPNRVSFEDKKRIVEEILAKNSSITYASQELGVTESTVEDWVRKYNDYGADALKPHAIRRKYTREFKEKAVQAVLSGEMNLKQATREFKISNREVLRSWIRKQEEGIDLDQRKSLAPLSKGRKTSFEERKEIVLFTLKNKRNFAESAEKYKVSYHQVYTWVQKYEESGDAGLEDNRGRIPAQTKIRRLEGQVERLQVRIRELEKENRKLTKEIAKLR